MSITSTKVQISTDPTFNTTLVDHTHPGDKDIFSRGDFSGAVIPTGVPLHIRAKKIDSELGDSDWGDYITVRIQDTFANWSANNDAIGKYSDATNKRQYISTVVMPTNNLDIPSNKVLIATNDPANDNKLTVYMATVDHHTNVVTLSSNPPLVLENTVVPSAAQISLCALSSTVVLLNIGTTECIPLEVGTDSVSKSNNHLTLAGGGEYTKIGQLFAKRIALNTAIICIVSGPLKPSAVRVVCVKYNADTKAFTQGVALEIEGLEGELQPYCFMDRIDDTKMIVGIDKIGTPSASATARVITANTAGNLNISAGSKFTIDAANLDDQLIGLVVMPGSTKFAAIFKVATNNTIGIFTGGVSASTISALKSGLSAVNVNGSINDIFTAVSGTTIVGNHANSTISAINISAVNDVTVKRTANVIGAKLDSVSTWVAPNRATYIRGNRVLVAYSNRLFRLIG